MSPYPFEEYVPHAAPMALLDYIEDWHEEGLQASVVIRADAPFADERGVPAWVGIEYMAQSIAAYAGFAARRRQESVKIGFLVGARRYNCECEYFPLGTKLRVTVTKEIEGENGLNVFACVIADDTANRPLADANLNVFQPEDPDAFLAASAQ